MANKRSGRKNPAFKAAGEKKGQSGRWSLEAQPNISSLATWEWDIAAGVCHYSPEWAGIIGVDPSVLEGVNNWSWWSGQMHMDDMPGVLETHRRFFAGLLEEAEIIHRLRRGDGRWVRLLSRGAVSCWKDDGTPAVMSGLTLDISHLDLEPPLPEGEDPDGSVALGAKTGADSLESAVREWTNPAWQRSRLNERRLKALYQLTQMENSTDEELLHFTLTSILQLTGSPVGFLFLPDEEFSGRGRFIWSRTLSSGERKCLHPDSLPEEAVALIRGVMQSRHGLIVNGDGSEPVEVVLNGALPLLRYIIAPGLEDERIVLLAGVANKPADYDDSDLQQMETLINSAWLILRRRRDIMELQRAKEAAEAASRAKNEFLANVSHELRTPMNGLLSMLQLLEDFPMEQKQREFLETARLSGNALKYIISDILDFSHIESGKMQLAAERFDFKSSVSACLRPFREEARERGLAFAINMDPAIPDLVIGDGTRIRQIISNLVSNSLKFTKEGGITIACSRLPDGKGGRLRLLLDVSDTGIGIPLDKQGALFNAFTQVDSFSTKKHQGTGLGLSIVKRLTGMMGGEVRLESEPGKGTRLSCSILLDLPGREGAGAPPAEYGQAAQGQHASLDILVAEDDAVGRFALRAFLERLGHRVVTVNNGCQALQALQLYPFDCLFTDIQMPEMDGLELVRRIRSGKGEAVPPSDEVRAMLQECLPRMAKTPGRINPDTIIVAVSAHAMAGDRERFLEHGVQYYIAKPVSREQLSAVLVGVTAALRQPGCCAGR